MKPNYVGPDGNKKYAPSAEKRAEIDGESDEGDFFEDDIKTIEGTAVWVRPAWIIFAVHSIYAIITSLPLILVPSSLAWMAFGILSALIPILLTVFIYLRSRIAAILAAVYVGWLWILQIVAIMGSNFSLIGVAFMAGMTGAVAFAIPTSFAYQRLKLEEIDAAKVAKIME